jgi:hypothetical protein
VRRVFREVAFLLLTALAVCAFSATALVLKALFVRWVAGPDSYG